MPARSRIMLPAPPKRTAAPFPSPAQRPEVSAARVVHVAAECWPFARTGGLGEMVSTLAAHHASNGLATAVVLPLYAHVRERCLSLRPVCANVPVRVGNGIERVTVWRQDPGTQGHDVFFIESPESFARAGIYGQDGRDYPDNAERFGLLCMATLSLLPQMAPDARIVHAHDWHAALVPLYLRTVFAESEYHQRLKTVLSVHNAAFQGHGPPALISALGIPPELFDWRVLEWYGRVNLLKGGLVFADAVTAVSPTHARELVTTDGGFGLHDAFAALGDRLVGIVNGLDQDAWDPSTDAALARRYDPGRLAGKRCCKEALQREFGLAVRDDLPVAALCARLTPQKGIDILLESEALNREDIQVVILGEGEDRFAEALHARAAGSPGRIAVRTTFSDQLEHVLMGGADVFLMPSRYEPCGLSQLRAQRYGALPVAHRVGGLVDTIEHGVTGFLFDEHTARALDEALGRALAVFSDRPAWRRMMRAAMTRDFGWSRSADAYRDLYRRASEAPVRRMACA